MPAAHFLVCRNRCAAVLLRVLPHADGKRAAHRPAARAGGRRRYRHHALHCPQPRRFPANGHNGALPQRDGGAPSHATGRDLRLLLHTSRHLPQSAAAGSAHRVVLHKQLFPCACLSALSRHAHDVGTCIGRGGTQRALRKRSDRGAGNGVPATRADRHARAWQPVAQL